MGAKAVAVIGSTEEGEKLVQAAVDAFGGIHGLFFSLFSLFSFLFADTATLQ